MTGMYQRDHMLARAGELKPGDIGLINQVLAGAGITQRLGDPAENPPGRLKPEATLRTRAVPLAYPAAQVNRLPAVAAVKPTFGTMLKRRLFL